MAGEPPEELKDPAAVAHYVATLTAELSMLAHHHGFDALGFLLEMARLEAENAAQGLNGTPGAGTPRVNG